MAATGTKPPVLEVVESKSGSVEENFQTFILHDEDHTLGNSLKYILNKSRISGFYLLFGRRYLLDNDLGITSPDVVFVGYSITHPSENKINLRIQTTGKPAVDVLRQGLKDLMKMCGHMLTTFESATKYYKENHMEDAMDQS